MFWKLLGANLSTNGAPTELLTDADMIDDFSQWGPVEAECAGESHRGRFRLRDGWVVLEWRGGRLQGTCGLLRPDVVATLMLRAAAADEARTG